MTTAIDKPVSTLKRQIAELSPIERIETTKKYLQPHSMLNPNKKKALTDVKFTPNVVRFLEENDIEPSEYMPTVSKIIERGYGFPSKETKGETSVVYPSNQFGVMIRVGYRKVDNVNVVTHIGFGRYTVEILEQFQQTPEQKKARIVIFSGVVIDTSVLLKMMPFFPNPMSSAVVIRNAVENDFVNGDMDATVHYGQLTKTRPDGTQYTLYEKIYKKKTMKKYKRILVRMENDVVVNVKFATLNKYDPRTNICPSTMSQVSSN